MGFAIVPTIQRDYISDNRKYYHYWFEPVYNVLLWMNLTNPVLSDVAVRKAMAYAINRPEMSKIGEYGYEPPSNQTGIVGPTSLGGTTPAWPAGMGMLMPTNRPEQYPSSSMQVQRAPFGTAAASDFERYSSKSTDALINQYAVTTIRPSSTEWSISSKR